MSTINVMKQAMLAAFALGACSQAAQSSAQAQDAASLFAARATQQVRLPPALQEISGLAVSPDGRLFAHDDEQAVIYQLDTRTGEPVKSFSLGEPAETGDFEGLAITPAGDFWMTTSNGRLMRFREGENGANVTFERYDTGLRNVCEIEGLAYLASEESLILACKRNESRDMRDTISLHAWRIGAEAAAPWRSLPVADVAGAAQVRAFRPSSLDIDAATGRLVLLSANNGALAELSAEGELLSARALGREHIQAEGAAVLPDGSLAIADEGGDGRALLSIYPRGGQ